MFSRKMIQSVEWIVLGGVNTGAVDISGTNLHLFMQGRCVYSLLNVSGQ